MCLQSNALEIVIYMGYKPENKETWCWDEEVKIIRKTKLHFKKQ